VSFGPAGRALLSVAVATIHVACGGGPGVASDGGGPVDGGDAGVVPVAPAPPDIPWLLPDGGVELPARLLPCPEGWREAVTDSGVAVCEPYPAAGPASCPAGEAHFPGEPGCAALGSPCPAGDFGDGLPDDATVLFVLAGALAGDGSRSRPFGRIGEATGRATAGMTVAIGRGRYDGIVTPRAGVILAGACAAETIVGYSGADPRRAVVNVSAGGVTVQDLTIGASDRVGIVASGAAAELTLAGVAIEGVTEAALRAERGARIRASGIVARGTRSDAAGAFGRGLDVGSGAQVEVRRAVFEQNREACASVFDAGTSLVLAGVVIRETQSRERDRGAGAGIVVQGGASLDVSRSLVAESRGIGITGRDPGTSLVLTDVIVRDTRGEESSGEGGYGLSVDQGARAMVTRSLFERNRAHGVLGNGAGSSLVLADAVVRDTGSRERDATQGAGLVITDGGSAEVSRALFEGNRALGLFVTEPGSSLLLADAVVRDTRSEERTLAGGRGLNVQSGATAEVSRILLERNRDASLFAGGPGTSLLLTDAVVRDTGGQEGDRARGRGLDVELGASARLTRALFERNREMGVIADGPGTALVLEDVVVRDTESQESDGAAGRGLGAQLGARVEVERAIFERNRELGVLAGGDATSLVMNDVVVRDSRATPLGLGGVGAGSYLSASLVLNRFLVSGSALAGIQLARDGTVDLHEGEVSHNLVGVNVQTPGFDLARLTDRVVYRDNVRDIAADELPLPDLALPVDGR
jgi:hypothetical protein